MKALERCDGWFWTTSPPSLSPGPFTVGLWTPYARQGSVPCEKASCPRRFQLDCNFNRVVLGIAHGIGHRRNEGICLSRLGLAYRALGQFDRAIKLHEEALPIAREIGDRWGEGARLADLGLVYYTLGRFEQAIKLYKKALAIAREIGQRREESRRLMGLGKALLAAGEVSATRQRCTEALALDVPLTSYQAALVLGIVLLHQHDAATGDAFTDADARCRAMLDKTPNLYEPRYALAAALVGQAVCDPRWADESERAKLLIPALKEYRRALEITSAPGIVHDALRDLEMIRAAGIEGLEPAFELLEDYMGT
jgi:tetratricopeptide (TPR) repeat protein